MSESEIAIKAMQMFAAEVFVVVLVMLGLAYGISWLAGRGQSGD